MRNNREWWRRLYDRRYRLHPRQGQARFISKAYRWGLISEWQLWDVLGTDGGPVSCHTACDVCDRLGLVPFSGYPLSKAGNA